MSKLNCHLSAWNRIAGYVLISSKPGEPEKPFSALSVLAAWAKELSGCWHTGCSQQTALGEEPVLLGLPNMCRTTLRSEREQNFFFIFMFSSRHQNWFPEISAVYNFNSFCIALLFFCTGSFFFLISSVICFGKSNFILLSAAAWDGHNIYKWCHEQVMQIIQMRTSKLLYPAKQSCIVEMPCFTVNLRNVLETLKH